MSNRAASPTSQRPTRKAFANTQASALKLSGDDKTLLDGQPSHFIMLNIGKAPKPWQQERVWIDLIPDAEVMLPGMALRCEMKMVDHQFELAVLWNLSSASLLPDDAVQVPLGQVINLKPIVGYHCYLIPRAMRPCTDLTPAAVLLEINAIRIPQ